MRSWVCPVTLCAAALLAAARPDHDFEFEDARDAAGPAASTTARRPRRYVYDPHNALCRALSCPPREACVLRDARIATCARRRDLLRRGDTIVGAGEAPWDDPGDDDVFYEAGGGESGGESGGEGGGAGEGARCVGCGAGSRGSFLCGSDNRTYSSLCRLDLHNCVRRAARPAQPVRPVRPACKGFCPCRLRRARPRARPRPEHNEVLPARRRLAHGAEGCALDKMADRLLDWFSVLMEDAGATAPPPTGFPGGCKGEVRWMFAHLDADGDARLSGGELYALRHDERERCLRPFLAGCGAPLTRAAWCGCLRRAARPCAALARAHPAGAGGYAPRCDARGFYRPRQCHAALAVCWCVDAHGVERPGSRTKGAPACPGEAESGDGETVDGAPDDDEDGAGQGRGEGEGSGEGGPRFPLA